MPPYFIASKVAIKEHFIKFKLYVPFFLWLSAEFAEHDTFTSEFWLYSDLSFKLKFSTKGKRGLNEDRGGF